MKQVPEEVGERTTKVSLHIDCNAGWRIERLVIRHLLCPQPLFFVIPSQDKESLDVFDHAGEPSGDIWSSNRTRHSYRKGRE